jgi:peptidyl-prolyl cis-trans isomerase D
MQIIQSIRDKGAAITVTVIVLCLIGFILMDAKPGNNSLFGSSTTSIGKVNGEAIEIGEFNKRINQAELQEEQRSGQRPTGVKSNQLRDQVWNQVIAERIFFAEADKLGIRFTAAELSSILLSSDQNNPFMQQQGMADPATGQLDITKAQEALRNIKKLKGEQKEAVNTEIINPLKLTSIVTKYSSLINASAYYPKWMQDKETIENKTFAQISYVAVPYSEISDSAVVVKDSDINEYVKKHKELFKQEAGRVISYVVFSQLPNAADSNNAKTSVENLKTSFAADTNAKAFVARNTSVIDFQDAYLPKARIQSSQTDSIAKLPVGTVYGPYVDGGSYVLAKMLGTKQLPDSVKARHILIPTTNPQTGEVVNADSTAKKLADSIFTAIKGGADFAALAAKYSSDGSKDKGGDLGTFGFGAMVPEFNDFTFNNPVGSKGVVKTQFGYHVIEITNQTDFKPAYKIAFLAKEITASDLTINQASLQATKASGVKTGAELAKYVAANGLNMVQNPTPVKENDFSLGGLEEARPLVRWAFEAKKGEVSEPFSIGDQFVVAVVDKILEEGVQDAETARSGAEVIIRNEKKAAMIKTKLGATPTLESAAAAYNKQVMQAGADSSLTFSSQIINGVGVEPKMIGASFNKAFQAKPSPAFAGTSAVYVMKVNSLGTKPADAPEMAMQQVSSRLSALRSQTNNWYEGLRKQATIKDNRSKVF